MFPRHAVHSARDARHVVGMASFLSARLNIRSTSGEVDHVVGGRRSGARARTASTLDEDDAVDGGRSWAARAEERGRGEAAVRVRHFVERARQLFLIRFDGLVFGA